jgi:hypothetical protein
MKKLFVVILVCAVFCTACSHDEKKTSHVNRAQTKAAQAKDATGLNASARIIGTGLLKGDAQAVYEQLSTSCQKNTSVDQIANQLQTGKSYMSSLLHVSMKDFSIKSVETRKVTYGKTGQARYTMDIKGKSRDALEELYKSSAEDKGELLYPFDKPTGWYKFEFQKGAWRLLDCDVLQQTAKTLTGS